MLGRTTHIIPPSTYHSQSRKTNRRIHSCIILRAPPVPGINTSIIDIIGVRGTAAAVVVDFFRILFEQANPLKPKPITNINRKSIHLQCVFSLKVLEQRRSAAAIYYQYVWSELVL